ncbi:MAG: GYD domain-containing protein [Acidimicrobiales bacterium]
MAKYLLKVRYTAEGLSGVMRDGGSARRAAAQDLCKAVGGSVESFHFAFGDDDAYAICDLPDNKAAATIALTVSASGRVAVSTVARLTLDEIDAIAAGSVLEYSPPGS